MKTKISPEVFEGVWSATPTPFNSALSVDEHSVVRMVDHHVSLGVKGLFLAGTCGEGPWMRDSEKRRLVQAAVAAARGRLRVAVQVTDNSAPRILDNIACAREDGADFAIIAPPYFLVNVTPKNLQRLYLESIRESPLPIAFYDRGRHSSILIPHEILESIYSEPNVIAVKDSSSDPKRREVALAARRRRPQLRLLTGDEFRCVEYLRAGYDGLLLGGAIFHGKLAVQIGRAVANGDLSLAEELERHMIRLMYAVYGGKRIFCWLSGVKYLLVKMRIFRTANSHLNYPLTSGCRHAIDRVLAQERSVLFPENRPREAQAGKHTR
ncbi:MAG TPA: dihydrodipicolinate synthase family protein [Verrucomicrobiae bacterium]|nr:dihydrodipicolinate synthase family protein [Verrucomicrobiae bacterium]